MAEQKGLSVKNLNNSGSVRLVDLSNNTNIIDVPINEAKKGQPIDKGTIIMFKGSFNSLPTEWRFCDGTHNTPDLRNRFIVGAGPNFTVNSKGGASSVKVPSHTHAAVNTPVDPKHKHTHSINFAKVWGGKHSLDHTHTTLQSRDGNVQTSGYGGTNAYNHGHDDNTSNYAGAHTHYLNIGAQTSSNGDSKHKHTITITKVPGKGKASEDNLPPYYKLAFIQKVL